MDESSQQARLAGDRSCVVYGGASELVRIVGGVVRQRATLEVAPHRAAAADS